MFSSQAELTLYSLIYSFCSYNPALSVPPGGWAMPPRAQPWFPPYPAVSVTPSMPAPLPPMQQPLFPVQTAVPPTSIATFPSSLQITPPGLPSSNTSLPVSQPLFPVGNSSMTMQSTPYVPPGIAQNSPADLKSLVAHASVGPTIAGSILLHFSKGLNFLWNSSIPTITISLQLLKLGSLLYFGLAS